MSKITLSKETQNILKNFSSINSNLLLKPGNKLTTISSQKNIMASVTVTETFPEQFGIYDLNEFLGVLSLFNSPELEFSSKWVTVREGANSVKFFSAADNVLIYPEKDIKFPQEDVQFTLSAQNLQMIQKTSSVLRATDVSIIGDGENLTVQVGDKKNSTSNSFVAQVGETDKEFTAHLKVENLKIIPGEYSISLSSKRISRFQSTSSDLLYYIAVEQDSSFT